MACTASPSSTGPPQPSSAATNAPTPASWYVDVRKLGRIPDSGGWRIHSRDQRSHDRRLLVGFDYVHSAVDDHSRLADLGATGKHTRPYRPQTNGKAERFNRTLLDEWAYVRPDDSNDERTAALQDFLHTYNHHRCHTALDGHPPITRVNNPAGQCNQRPRLDSSPNEGSPGVGSLRVPLAYGCAWATTASNFRSCRHGVGRRGHGGVPRQVPEGHAILPRGCHSTCHTRCHGAVVMLSHPR